MRPEQTPRLAPGGIHDMGKVDSKQLPPPSCLEKVCSNMFKVYIMLYIKKVQLDPDN